MMAAFYTACSSFIAQNFGARKKKRILQTYLICLFYSFITSLVLGVGIYLARYPFLYLFTSDKAVVEAGAFLQCLGFYGCFHCCLKRSWKDSCSYFCCCYGIMRISYNLDIYDIRLFPYHPVAIHPICILLGNHCNCGKYIFLPCLSPYTDRKKRIVLIKKTFRCSFFNEQLEGLYLIISRTFFCIHSQNKH